MVRLVLPHLSATIEGPAVASAFNRGHLSLF
jgi:hypothetical protein